MKEENFNITCSTDDKYVQHCMVMLCSLFENNTEKKFFVHILINCLSDTNQEQLRSLATRYGNEVYFYKVNEKILDGVKFRNKRPLTKAAYYRLLLPSILSELKTVLYLDCDIVVLGDVSELFHIDLSDFALAACLDPMPFTDTHRRQINHPVGTKTFCSGMMYINLDYWRNHDSEKKCLDFAKKERTPVYLHDQDVLNYVFRDQWFLLPPKWNVSPMAKNIFWEGYKMFDYVEYYTQPQIYHYCAHIKPWQNLMSLKRSYYLKYLKLSGFKSPKIEETTLKEKFKALLWCIDVVYWKNIDPYLPFIISGLIKEFINMYRLMKIFLFKIINNRQKWINQVKYFRYEKFLR